jgi:tetratricopeptide (TPR) repeat protein
MSRMTIGLLLIIGLLIAAGAGAGGCDKNKREEKQREKEIAQRQKGEADANASDEKFEKSDDPPFTADTRFAAGQLAESQGNLDNAIAQYRAAIKLNPKHLDAMFRLGGVYVQSRRFDEAIAMWQQYIKATNDAPQAYSNLALAYETAGRFDDAEKAYQAGIARDPKNQSCRVNYGLMLARRNQLDGAIAQLSTVLSPAEIHYNLGAVCEQQGRTEEAKAYYRKALELDPKLRDARARLSVLR